jgi:hypothetical protein
MRIQNINNKMLILVLVFVLLGLYPNSVEAHHGGSHCKGTSCNGLNPSTMGCSATTAGTVKVLLDGVSTVETRVSANGTLDSQCNAKWARVRNLSTEPKYLAGSLRYGCSNYCYAQSVSSPGKVTNISPNNQVFTPMQGLAATPTRSCGATSTSSQIAVPIGISSTSCTTAN